jgi:hypothetical protein
MKDFQFYELYSLYKDPAVVRVIKIARIRWLGHLVRKEENSSCKKHSFFPAWKLLEKEKTQIKVAW